MASFKKFKIGNTSYDVKDANAGYSLSTSGSNLSLKNSAGTAISTVTVNGMDYDIIADKFDTTPIVTPGQGTLYHYGDYVTVNSGGGGDYCYKNIYGDVQSGNFDSSKWEKQTNFVEANTSTWVTANALVCDVVHGKKFYLCTNQYGGAMFDPNNIDQTNFIEVPEYDTTPYQPGGSSYHQYSVGDYVIYNNDLYRCTGATTGQSWNSSKWTQVQIMDEIPSVPSNIVNSVAVTPIYSSGTPIAQINVTSSSGSDGWTIVAPTVNAPLILESYNAITPTNFYNYLVAANDAGNAYSTPFTSNKNKAAITSAWKDPTVEIWLKIGNNIAKLITRCTESGSGDLTFVAQYGNTVVTGVQQNPYSAYACSNIYGCLNFSGNTLDSIDFYIDNSYYQSKYDHHI